MLCQPERTFLTSVKRMVALSESGANLSLIG